MYPTGYVVEWVSGARVDGGEEYSTVALAGAGVEGTAVVAEKTPADLKNEAIEHQLSLLSDLESLVITDESKLRLVANYRECLTNAREDDFYTPENIQGTIERLAISWGFTIHAKKKTLRASRQTSRAESDPASPGTRTRKAVAADNQPSLPFF